MKKILLTITLSLMAVPGFGEIVFPTIPESLHAKILKELSLRFSFVPSMFDCKFRALRKSSLEQDTQKALELAIALPQVKNRNYEVRILTFQVLLYALWLHADSDDILIPVPPTFRNYNEFQPYAEKDIAIILRREAKRSVDAWRKPEKNAPNP